VMDTVLDRTQLKDNIQCRPSVKNFINIRSLISDIKQADTQMKLRHDLAIMKSFLGLSAKKGSEIFLV
jgi:hypothetical protein